jgi:hypothetical protein
MDRKADLKIPTETLIGIVIFVIILLGVFLPLFIAGYNFFFGGKVSELSKNNYDRLSNSVLAFVNSNDNSSDIVVSFDGSMSILGFNYNCDKDKDPDCPKIGSDYLLKPKLCGVNRACLCYYKNANFDKPISCTDLNKNVVFAVADGTKDFSSGGFIFMPGASYGTNDIMMSKSEVNGELTVSFS